MSSARIQDKRSKYKNQLCFYTLALNNPKMKENHSFYNSIKNKTIINNVTKELQDLYTRTIKCLFKEDK